MLLKWLLAAAFFVLQIQDIGRCEASIQDSSDKVVPSETLSPNFHGTIEWDESSQVFFLRTFSIIEHFPFIREIQFHSFEGQFASSLSRSSLISRAPPSLA